MGYYEYAGDYHTDPPKCIVKNLVTQSHWHSGEPPKEKRCDECYKEFLAKFAKEGGTGGGRP